MDGEYTIRVYLMGNAASSDQTASYKLEFNIRNKGAEVISDATPSARLDASGKIKCSTGKALLDQQS